MLCHAVALPHAVCAALPLIVLTPSPFNRRIAVEVFDAGCFCSNQQQPLGDSVMRIQLLNACGWQVRGCECVREM